ncbi:MAG TPA: cupin domain-containing protein [Thermoleophilaceae bacterium]
MTPGFRSSAPGEGERWWFLGTLGIVRVPGEAVGGRYALIEFLFPHHASPPRHTHPQDETFIVVEGRLTMVAGDSRAELGPGEVGVAPAGCVHTFRVDSETARVLALSTPAGIEDMMRDASVPAVEETLPPPDTPRPSAQEIAAVFARHGQVAHGPPLGPED